jgi:hypothetical protein
MNIYFNLAKEIITGIREMGLEFEFEVVRRLFG